MTNRTKPLWRWPPVNASQSWMKECSDGRTACGRARPTSSDGSMTSKALRSSSFTMNVMMMRPKTLLRFSRPWLTTGEGCGNAQPPSCPTSVRLCSTPLAPLVKFNRGQQFLVQSSGKRRKSKQALRQVSTVGREMGWPCSPRWCGREFRFFQDSERLGAAPEQIGFARQAHIPKEGKGF